MRSTDRSAAPAPGSGPPGPPRGSGFILPTTLLVMTLLTVMLTAAFILASAEFRATDNSLANSRALALAQAGLENYFSLQRNLDTTSSYDSVRITLTGGYADVVSRRVRAQYGAHLPLWLVRSVGTSTDPRQPGQVQGVRAAAQLAELNPGTIPARAAITAVNGIQMVAGADPSNPINGHNFGFSMAGCTIPGGSAADTAAYLVGSASQSPGAWSLSSSSSGSYTKAAGSGNLNQYFNPGDRIVVNGFSSSSDGYATITSFSGPNQINVSKSPAPANQGAAGSRSISLANGNYLNFPAGAKLPSGTAQAFPISDAYDSTHIDWQRVLNGDFSPDFVNTWPPVCTGTCTYNSYFWSGNVTVPAGQRRALLIATGDVTLSAGTHWDGIIIAGGALKAVPGASNSFILHGMAITGLNCGVGNCPATQDSIQRGSSNDLQWDWCYTHAAIGGLNGLVPLKNTWVDTWSLY